MTERTRDSIAHVWGDRTPYHGEHGWPERLDVHLDEEPDRWVQSVCVLCSNGCGLDIGVKDGQIVGVRGRVEDRVNRGRLGPKGMHGWVANHAADRLTKPLIRVGKKSADQGVDFSTEFREATWDEAMDLVARRSRETIDRFTGDAIGIYNSGQLFTEEYYTLGVIASAGLRTQQLDANVRLCTATTGAARWETFGAAVIPGSYTDVDVTDCMFLIGHNVANTQTVLWMRMLDRLAGPNPPKLVVVDPRETHTAREATVHLAPRLGTNVAVMNGLLHLIVDAGQIDEAFIAEHTIGYEQLAERVRSYTPARVEEITGTPQAKLREAAEILGTTPTLVSTALQGVYQSNQATAAAVQVNNLNLIRGMVGRPGCAILQMNGQPSAQNTHEAGADGDYAGFRNWRNPRHMQELADLWNVEVADIPHWGQREHVMEIFRHAEHGSVRMLWIVGTNPAVSLPDLSRIRNILAREELFVVVSDAFMTETAQLADVVLPAAIWGEKTGTLTNADRTVHLSHKAVDPPGEAKSDLDIFLEYARRMDFRDKDGQPLVKWTSPEEAFDAWRECSRGRPCDYSGMTYEKLTGGSGIQWPCNDEHPEGTERYGADLVFPTDAEVCQTYGHDLETGAAVSKEEYEALNPAGRAIIKSADYIPPIEEPDEAYPFWLTTYRNVYHFQTRTKTGKSRELHDAAPDAVVQVHPEDAAELGISKGEMVEVSTRRGTIEVPAQLTGIERGTVAIPYHYGYWDEREGRRRAADELTLNAWDPVSKQPHFKFAAAQLRKVKSRVTPSRLVERAGALAGQAAHVASEVMEKASTLLAPERSYVADYLGIVRSANEQFVRASEILDQRLTGIPQLQHELRVIAGFSRDAIAEMQPFTERYGSGSADDSGDLADAILPATEPGDFAILRGLHGLFVLSADTRAGALILEKAAHQMGDMELRDAMRGLLHQIKRQEAWLKTHFDHMAPHTLVVPL